MKLVKKDKELRNIALTVKLTASERARLAELASHYETSNADLLVWLVGQEIGRLETHSIARPKELSFQVENDDSVAPETPSIAALEALTAKVTLLLKEVQALKVHPRQGQKHRK
jgi:hypothetical protein